MNLKKKFREIDPIKEIWIGTGLFLIGLFLWFILFELNLMNKLGFVCVITPAIIGTIIMLDSVRRV